MPRFSPLLGLLLLTVVVFLGLAGHHLPVPRPHQPPPIAVRAASGAGAAFVDVTRRAGLNYRWVIPGPRPIDILQGIGNGCAFLDYDNSGDLSVLLVGTNHVALFKGDGHGHFRDVSRRMGIDKLKGHFLGCCVGDYDNDGYDDVYLSGYRTGVLLHNDHGRRFVDVTRQAGLKPQLWGTSCAFVDVDNDGSLDLYVGGYCRFDGHTGRLCSQGTLTRACDPGVYPADRGTLYHNEGQGRFRDVTAQWGALKISGYTLGVACADYDHSGHPSLALANDGMPGNLLRYTGAGVRDVGVAAGTAYDGRGHVYAGMGIDWGDYDNDGRLDLVVGTYEHQPKCLFHNEGGVFSDLPPDRKPVESVPWLVFGAKWLDYDNDGWLDLMLAAGHVFDNVAQVESFFDNAHIPGYAVHPTYRQSTELFHNAAGQRFDDAGGGLIGPASRPIVGRGLAIGDFDNDGKVDALVVDSEGAPLLLHNETKPCGHWLSVTLVGTRSNRDGYGAFVIAKTPGLAQTRLCHADGSYLSSSDKRVHIGLGVAMAADLVVHWSSGTVTTRRHVPADRHIVMREDDSE